MTAKILDLKLDPVDRLRRIIASKLHRMEYIEGFGVLVFNIDDRELSFSREDLEVAGLLKAKII